MTPSFPLIPKKPVGDRSSIDTKEHLCLAYYVPVVTIVMMSDPAGHNTDVGADGPPPVM